ncbi:Phage tail fiber [Collimonas arenae]|uniref:Phage tail fiber n=1 Tax=Collimonas arenae TaxID=279058 RepID=A0A0A1FH82_9BURK|nr:Phage tail fiber [Collimonas arenae]
MERALEQSTARLAAVPLNLRPNWNPRTCPAHLLPWLAWALGVEEWDADWPEAFKREVIATSRAIRRQKGTPGAIKRALAALGHPNAQVIERSHSIRYDGKARFDGSRTYGGKTQWATFSVILTRPVTIKQAALIRQRIHSVKRSCCHLTGLDFSTAPNQYNGALKYDGTYTYGIV